MLCLISFTWFTDVVKSDKYLSTAISSRAVMIKWKLHEVNINVVKDGNQIMAAVG